MGATVRRISRRRLSRLLHRALHRAIRFTRGDAFLGDTSLFSLEFSAEINGQAVDHDANGVAFGEGITFDLGTLVAIGDRRAVRGIPRDVTGVKMATGGRCADMFRIKETIYEMGNE